MTKDEALKIAIEALDTLMMEKGSIYQQALQACKEALEQTAQEPVMCDGKFPENFDASLNIPAQYLRLANGIMMDYMGKRLWDVPMCATAIMEFITTHPAQSWQGLSDAEIFNFSQQCDLNHILGLIDYGRAIEQALKDKNT